MAKPSHNGRMERCTCGQPVRVIRSPGSTLVVNACERCKPTTPKR